MSLFRPHFTHWTVKYSSFSLLVAVVQTLIFSLWLPFSDDDFDMSRYSSSGYSSAEVRCLRDQVSMHTMLYCSLYSVTPPVSPPDHPVPYSHKVYVHPLKEKNLYWLHKAFTQQLSVMMQCIYKIYISPFLIRTGWFLSVSFLVSCLFTSPPKTCLLSVFSCFLFLQKL